MSESYRRAGRSPVTVPAINVPKSAFLSLCLELAADESASALAEYSLVLATLTISTIVTFQLVTASANTNVSGNEQNLTTSATAAGAGYASP